MEKIFEITIPMKAVSVNQSYPSNKQGRRYLSDEAKTFRQGVQYHCVGKVPWKLTDQDKFEVIVGFIFKDNRRRDVDDYIKIFFDSLNGMAWLDDSQIEQITAFKYQGRDEDCVVLTVKKL